ncbi:putative protein phosphatase 2C [Trypanosoma rangeli]|uniref:PPM-type phosphatase domain-containing protein n=1 Tax=Trypanosoma rangeli TaxID=5698 RepID=A0A3S5IQP3_TRYRA|nr:putative protein phosphatase 2C [Trypanosoma rangeli]RNF01502.1 putative protein phosphatase 2C [Trypanosoma rangeli]|eukprot:RNF01502.1 putative protein phosphatase 2C [Trypanosoma rangeli]
MYTSIRKPPLAPTKGDVKTPALRKKEVGMEEHTLHGVIPSVPRTVPPRNYTQRNGGNPLMLNSQRGNALPYQTTNSLFAGSVAQGKTGEFGSRNGSSGNIAPEHEDSVNPTSGGVMRSGNGRGPAGRCMQSKASLKRNSSDNVASIFEGSLLTGVDRSGNGAIRKVFSGPPSSRVLAGQGGGSGNSGDGTSYRPHPPGSGGPKLGVRPIQFALNANGNPKLSPVPPRPPVMFSSPKTTLDIGPDPLRQNKRLSRDVVDPFATTHVFNGVGAQRLSSESGEGGTRWTRDATPFALASVKLQQLALPPTKTSPRMASGSPAALSRYDSHSDTLINGGKLPSSTLEDGTNKGNILQYDFRVVASTGKTFSSPIKLTFGVGSLQGLRPTMEDEHFVRLNAAVAAGQPVSLFGILDGHCGRRVADLASKQVPDNFIAHSALGENNALAFVESIIQADRAIFHAMGKGTGGGAGVSCGSGGGSTLIAAAVHGRMLYVACLGDARAVLYDGNTTIPMSEDHKPSSKREHTRILQCGGFVQFGRVCGILAVSRALGDYEFKFNGNRFIANKELMVSNVADVRQINLTDSSKFLLLACDGLWDVVENEEATQFVRDFLSYTPDVGSSPEATKRALNNCCQKLAEFAVDRGSTDNVSVMLFFFHDVAEVVAGFDRPVGAVVPSHTGQSVSPRLSAPSRGLPFSGSTLDGCSHMTSGASGTRNALFGSVSSWHGRGRSIW